MSDTLPRFDDDGPEPIETQIATFAPAVPRQTRPRLKWKDALGPHTLVLTDRLVIGTSPSAGIVLTDRIVSRLHAELEPRPDGSWWMNDLGSRNGTFLEDIQVTGARLPATARIRMGATEFIFETSTETAPVELSREDRFGELVGSSLAMRRLFHYLEKISGTDSSILIGGETGTGKELVARSIHECSSRRGKPFIVVDCGALPENLIESELFGHLRGAFTGATATTVGAIEAANGGTIFFDEIGELPLSMQPKLLRVLERREVRRIGEATSRKVDVRILSASHRDLRTMVNDGAFREDLYFRLAVLPVHVPSLRERPDDIPLLLQHFLAASPSVHLSPEVIETISKRPWLGNVRELRNFVERITAVGSQGAMSLSFTRPPPPNSGGPSTPLPATGSGNSGARISPRPDAEDGDPLQAIPHAPALPSGLTADPTTRALLAKPFKEFREDWVNHGEREYISQLLERHQRNVSAAAQEAGLDRTYLYRLIRKHLR